MCQRCKDANLISWKVFEIVHAVIGANAGYDNCLIVFDHTTKEVPVMDKQEIVIEHKATMFSYQLNKYVINAYIRTRICNQPHNNLCHQRTVIASTDYMKNANQIVHNVNKQLREQMFAYMNTFVAKGHTTVDRREQGTPMQMNMDREILMRWFNEEPSYRVMTGYNRIVNLTNIGPEELFMLIDDRTPEQTPFSNIINL